MTLLAFRLAQAGCGLKARPGWLGQAAAVKQSPAVAAATPGAGSCPRPMAACVKLSEVLSLTEHQAAESVHPRKSSEIQMYYCEAGRGSVAERTFAENCCSISRGLGWQIAMTRPRVLPSQRELLHSQISKWEPSSFIMSPVLGWARLASLLLYSPGPCLLSLRHPRPSPGPSRHRPAPPRVANNCALLSSRLMFRVRAV